MKKYCNGNCNQGRTCDCGDPYPLLDYAIFGVAVWFLVAALMYLFGGWR